MDTPKKTTSLQHRLDPLLEARLTNVVHRLRAAWLADVAKLWGDIHPIYEDAVGDFDQRVSLTLRDGFFYFSQFLAGFEVLVLEIQQHRVMREQTLLSLEKLLIDLRNSNGNLVEISKIYHSLGELPGTSHGSNSCRK